MALPNICRLTHTYICKYIQIYRDVYKYKYVQNADETLPLRFCSAGKLHAIIVYAKGNAFSICSVRE